MNLEPGVQDRRLMDVLIFVEDPGAANYVAGLPAALAQKGWRTRMLAGGLAYEHLRQQGVTVESVPHPATAEKILASTAPRLLLVGTSSNLDTLGLKLVTAVRSMGIESIGVVDGLANADYRFRGRSDNPLAYAPDWLLLPDEWTKEAYVALGYPAERAVACGHPHYDYVRRMAAQLAREDRIALRQRLLPGVSNDQKVIVFAAETSTSPKPQQCQRSAEYTLVGRGKSTGRTDIVLEEFLDATPLVNPRPYLVLRLHPKNTLDEFTAYLDEFDLVSRGGSPLELIYVADLVVGMTTMLLMEAALLGRPTLAIVPRMVEKTWLPTIGAGVTTCATRSMEVREQLSNVLSGAIKPDTAAVDRLIPFDSSGRVIGFIERLLDVHRG